MAKQKGSIIAKPDGSRWLELFLDFIGHLSIDSKESGVGPLELYGSQRRFLAELIEGLERDVHLFVNLKAMQLGISTLVLAVDLFWLAVHPGMQGLLLTDTDGNRQKFRVILKRFLASLPKSYSMKIAKGGDNREHMVFENGSVLDFIAAGTRMTSTEVGRSRAYNFVHACMAPGTPVITEHGRIKPIEDVKIGDKVLTHTGAATTVIDVVGQPNTKGPMLRITPWRGQSVICTRDHTIPTQRGVIEAKDLCKDDLLVMPVRTISGGGHTVQLQATRAAVSPQVNRKKSWKRLAAAGAELTISMTEEVGFAIGYYLAEGHLLHASTNGYPCGITFTRHRNEKAYADRAIAALQPFTTGHRKTVDRTTCLTSVDTIYGTPLAKWIDDTFGCVAEKRIPDDVFGWGVEFCRGLLAGLLCGDGSKTSSKTKSPTKRKPGGGGKYIFKTRARAKLGVTYPTNLVVMPTTRSSLATQARDIAASLGFGWGAISYKAGGDHYGRICKPCWRITWSGSAAFKLRALMGLPEIQRAGKDNIEKYTINDGFVYLKIRKIEKGIIESEMWDISVDHEDHTFRTPHMAVGNTEIANYGAVEGVASLIDRLAEKHPDRLYIFESTAKGYNLFWKLWQKAKSDPISQKAFFIGWWAKEDYSIPEDDPRFAQYWDGDVFVEEQDRVNNVWEKYGVRITPSQIAWYRWKCEQSSDPTLIDQNFPWDEEDAFLQTGQTFFPIKRTVALVNSLTENPPPFKGYAYEFAEKFMDTKIRSVRSADDAHLKIYEEPSDIGQYAMGVDPAYGRSENKDLSCIEIYRCYADRLVQVAEFATSDTESYQVAWVMAHLAGAYKNVMMIVEINGPGGATVNEIKHLRELFEAGLLPTPGNGSIEDIFGGARWFMFHRADSPGPGYSYNWKTSQDLTLTAMNELRDSFTTGLIEVRSIQCALEIQSMVQDGFRIQPALSTSKDDRVFGSMFAHRAWAEWIRPGMIGDMLTYERVRNMEAGRSEGDHDSMISFVISDFFQRKDDERDEQEIEDAWE